MATLKNTVNMHKNKPGRSDSKYYEQAASLCMTMHDARLGCLLLVAFLSVGWGVYVALLFGNSNEGISLGNLWANFDSHPVFFLVYGIFGAFITVSLIAGHQDVMRIASELELQGITIKGVIIDRWVESEGEGGCYFVGYQFSYMDSIFAGKQRAASYPYNKLQIGDSVEIRFLPRNPLISLVHALK